MLADGSHFGGNGSDGVTVVGTSSTGAIKVTLSVVAEDNQGTGIDIVSVSGSSHPVVGGEVANGAVVDSFTNNAVGGNGYDALNGVSRIPAR